jgi:cystathionine beta-synthase
VLNTILEAIGDTPLVRLNKVVENTGVKCRVLAKCEFFNAGGSVKDRIGLRMIQDAEESGRIKPGDTLIEPTSGNTGIGLALTAAVKGYNMVITLPEKMSQEKVSVLKGLGAEIVRTPTEAAWDSPDSHIGVACRLEKELENAHILDQYVNPSNPLAHYDGTAEEILEACDGHVDMVVVGAGTGGTLTGIGRKIKERCPDCQVIGVDPRGSILAEPDSLNDECRLQSYQVEGTGYDFIPTVLDRSIADRWIKTTDRDSLIMARRLIREEGLLCGGSSGANVWAALQAASELREDQTCVVILPDSVRNYLSKFLSDDWMWSFGFVDEEHSIGAAAGHQDAEGWRTSTVSDLHVPTPVTVQPVVTCANAIEIMEEQGFDQLPVVDGDGGVVGVVTSGNLTAKIASGRVAPGDSVSDAAYKQFQRVSPETTLGDLARVFDMAPYALVTATQRSYGADAEPVERTIVSGVVSRINLLRYIAEQSA